MTVIRPNVPHWHPVVQTAHYVRDKAREEKREAFRRHRQLIYLTGKLDAQRDAAFIEELVELYGEYHNEQPEPPRAS